MLDKMSVVGGLQFPVNLLDEAILARQRSIFFMSVNITSIDMVPNINWPFHVQCTITTVYFVQILITILLQE